MKFTMLLAVLAASLSAESISNGIKIETKETTEGLRVSVVPSGCNIDAVQVRVAGSRRGEGFNTQSAIKRVTRCDQRPVEFLFAGVGEVAFVGVDEMSISNTGSAK